MGEAQDLSINNCHEGSLSQRFAHVLRVFGKSANLVYRQGRDPLMWRSRHRPILSNNPKPKVRIVSCSD